MWRRSGGGAPLPPPPRPLSTPDSSPGNSPVHSWRMTTHNSCKKMSEHHLRNSSKELLQSPANRRAYSTRLSSDEKSLRKKKSMSADVASGYESCSSSLKSLNFDSDSELRESSKENMPLRSSTLSARKKLQFGGVKNLSKSPNTNEKNLSPSILKTPLENILTDANSPPRRASHSRRSLVPETSNASPNPACNSSEAKKRPHQPDSELNPAPYSKHSRSDPPKVRLSLFSSTSPNSVIPVKSFYSKTEKTFGEQHNTCSINSPIATKTDKKPTRHHSMINNSYLRHRKKGEMNRGVRHGIRKPKQNRKSNLSKTQALKLSLELIENSPLNNYIEEFMKSAKSDNNPQSFSELKDVGSLIQQIQSNADHSIDGSEMPSEESDDGIEEEEEIPSSNKFFKSSRKSKKVKAFIKLPHMKLRMKSGKLYLPERRIKYKIEAAVSKNVSELYSTMEKDVADLLNDDNEELSEKSAIDSLLNQWCEEDVPTTEPQVLRQSDEVYRSIENAEKLLQSRSFKSDDLSSMHSEATSSIDLIETESTDTAYVSDSNNQRFDGNFQFLPVNGGYILVEDSEMMDDSILPHNIDTELQQIEKNIVEIAKTNNINPEMLLSPTAQMCSMTSDLVLTSPQPVLLTNRTLPIESSTVSQKLFPLFNKSDSPNHHQHRLLPDRPKATKTPTTLSKKIRTSIRDQYLIDAGQKRFGATECNECGVIYQIGDAMDEADHLMHHTSADILRFNGWKSERLCGRWGEGRTIVVSPGDPASHWQRVHNVLERVVNPQLGFAVPLQSEKAYKIYLYIEKKQIVGCLVAEGLMQANKSIREKDVECCSTELYPVKCGVSRIWTHKAHRRKRIATNLLNSMRANFMFGHVLLCDEIAFSSPTAMGRSFAEKYFGTPDFFIYLK
ncbi:establishment of cohesion [Arctopsyche grandis]|uniref:establishment of cohesion n=1 Tax=Arctopsyche grandis TaxID=121162 RepID=UPI00406D8163